VDISTSWMIRPLLTAVFAVWLCTAATSAAEVCRFAGNTSDAGHVAVTTTVASTDGVTRVDVVMTFEATMFLWLHIHYLVEEISSWRGDNLERIAVNTRYLVGHSIIRQQWDDFQRASDGLQAYRVQAKTLADFGRRHPGFVPHWDPSTFGQSWFDDYPAASPERRPDLDLKGAPLPPGLRSPLALAFYWIRWLPGRGQNVPVFLPGFKAERLLELPIAATASARGTQWQAPLRHAKLSQQQGSTATAWTSPDGRLLQLAFEVHEAHGSAHGLITQQGCTGAPVAPADRSR
jgi:hypothetical protein